MARVLYQGHGSMRFTTKAAHDVPVHLRPGEPYGEKLAQRLAELAPNVLLIRPGEEVELV